MKLPLLWFVILIDVDNLRSDLRMNVYAILSLFMHSMFWAYVCVKNYAIGSD